MISASAAVETYVYDKNSAEDCWDFTQGDAKYSFDDTSISSTEFSAKIKGLYTVNSFKNYSKITATLNNKSSSVGNKMYIYFNYIDDSNYYRVSVGGAKTENPVQLHKTVEGETTLLASYDHYSINYSAALFVVKCDNGNISVKIEKNGASVDAITVTDTSLNKGYVGIGTQTCKGVFSDIKIEGNVVNEMAVESTNIEEGETNVEADAYFLAEFNYAIEPSTVTYDNVKVSCDGDFLESEQYSFSTSDKELRIDFTSLELGSTYVITIQNINNAMTEVFTRTFYTAKDPNYIIYEYNYDTVDYDWMLTASDNIKFSETGISAVNYKSPSAMLINYLWRDELEVETKFSNSATSAGNKAYVYFLYMDSNNYYSLTVSGTPSGNSNNSISLDKYVDGTSSTLDTVEYNAKSSAALFRISYKNGQIKVVAEKGGEKTVLFDLYDDTFNNGTVVFGSKNNNVSFSNINISGIADKKNINILECNIENGQTGISVKTEVIYTFDAIMDEEKISSDDVLIYCNDTLVDNTMYDIKFNLDSTEMKIVFKEELNLKSSYMIVLTPGIVSKDGGNTLLKSDSQIAFVTEPPEIEFIEALTCDGVEVEDLSLCKGKNVNVVIKLGNNKKSNEAQTYAVSAIVTDENSKVYDVIYYMGTIAPNSQSPDLTGTLLIPDIESNCKITYYFWDSFENMNVVLTSSEL